MENKKTNSVIENVEYKTKTPTKIQIIKFIIGLVAGVTIYLLIQLIF